MVAFFTSASAAGEPKVTLTLTDALLTTDGGKTVAGPVDRVVRAGDVLRYTIVAKNVGSAPAYQLAPVGPVPDRTVFVRIVSAAAPVTYTLDSKTWSAHPTVTVVGKDGKKTVKPASPDLYRGLRWNLNKPLAPHASDSFVYEVRVK